MYERSTMGTHPNLILMAVLKPDDLPMKTARLILENYSDNGDIDFYDNSFNIENDEKPTFNYSLTITESDYHKHYQLSASAGDLVLHKFITYGYGDTETWGSLVKQKEVLEQWCNENRKRYKYSYKIMVSANYW